MGFNVLNCDQACTDCIKSYKKKHDLKQGDSFKISCHGIPLDYVNTSMAENMDSEDLKSALSMLDPVTWAAEVLDWHCSDPDGEIWKRKTADNTLGEVTPYIEEKHSELIKQGRSAYNRPYQRIMLRCTSKRKVFRIGRQCGKCLESFTNIHMADGSMKYVKDINDGDMILAMDDDYKIVPTKAYKQYNGIKDVFELELFDGRTIQATSNHPFFVRKNLGKKTVNTDRVSQYQDEWKDLGKISIGDYIAVPGNTGELGTKDIDDDRYITLIGLLLGDGNIKSDNYRFSNITPEILDTMNDCLSLFDCELKQYDSNEIADYHIVYKNKVDKNTGQGKGHKRVFRQWLEEIGIYGHGSHTKSIPDFVMELKNKYIVKLIRALFGCDGWATEKGTIEIGYCSVSQKMAQQVVALLARFGIYAECRKKKATCNKKVFYAYQVTIRRSTEVRKFRDQIGILGKDKQVENVYNRTLGKAVAFKTRGYLENDIAFIKVKSIKLIGPKDTWDLTVPEHHNFIANNIISHNTESIAIAILHSLFTHKDFRVVVITPYQTQIELIFSRLAKLIKDAPSIKNSIKRYVKAPNFTIELHNGSRVGGWTAGTKSGGNADAVRGQKANMLVFDESDLLAAEDIASALAIVTNYPDATVWMSSTPTGKREKFYDACHSHLYKEYYYPSMVNPLWNDELEEFFRNELSDVAYTHEVLAEFGEQEQGVYQTTHIDDAMTDYRYEERKLDGWVYSIGIDWNDQKVGTTLAVVGYNPVSNIFRLFNRHIVSREGWTQHAAIEKLIELNRYWLPKCIYVDAGYGATQFEIIRKYGYDSMSDPHKGAGHPDARLHKITKQFDFGSKVTIKDPFTKQDVEKASKPFLVENSIRRFEQRTFQFSKYDTQLEAELRGYIIHHTTISGAPVYKQGNEKVGDHNLDALNLALVAFTLEGSEFGKVTYETNIAFSPNAIGQSRAPAAIPGRPLEKVPNAHEQQKPSMNRTSVIDNQSAYKNSPAANTNDGQRALWSWPGFERDAPRPARKVQGGLSGSRSGPPVRKKI